MYVHEYEPVVPKAYNNKWPLLSSRKDDHEAVRRYLRARNLSWPCAEVHGWYASRDFTHAELRVVIPCRTSRFGHVYWQARAVEDGPWRRYESPYGARGDAYVRLVHSSRSVLIVEGPMDALAAAGCGVEGIATMGIRPPRATVDHIVVYLRQRTGDVFVLFDSENEAQACATGLVLSLASQGIPAHLCSPPLAKDLAALSVSERKQLLRNEGIVDAKVTQGRQQKLRKRA